MKIFFCFIIIIFQISALSSNAWAETFSGIIHKAPNSVQLLTPDKSYSLVALNTLAAADLAKLKTGDYLQGYGLFNREQSLVKVQSVDFVGLRNLIGEWKSDNKVLIDISTFTEMNIYLPAEQEPDQYDKPVRLNYTISPDTGDSWSIILHTDSEIQTGRLELLQDKLNLEIRGRDNEKQTLRFTRSR